MKLAEIIARLAQIDIEVRAATTAADVDRLSTEKQELLTRKAELEDLENRRQTALDLQAGSVTGSVVETRGAEPNGTETRGGAQREPEDRYSTLEYRRAFMEYCQRGTPIGAQYRTDVFTSVTDVAAMIPTTILNEIIKQMKEYGQLYSRVRKTNIAGGVRVPILSLKPVATRITEGTPSERKKVEANTFISFSYLGLECKIATSILASVTSLPMFEQQITPLIVEAMTKQKEIEIIKGNGTSEMLGVAVDPRVLPAQVITLTSAEFTQWDVWKKKFFAKIPLAYRAGGVLVMGAGTFDGYIDGMVDANGQPIGRTNYGITEEPKQRFGGKDILEVEEDVISSYDSAAVGDVVAVYMKPLDFCINSNMQMAMYRWFDHETNQWVDKALEINDGKLLDAGGVLILKKGA